MKKLGLLVMPLMAISILISCGKPKPSPDPVVNQPNFSFPQKVVPLDSDLHKELESITQLNDHGCKQASDKKYYYQFTSLTSYFSDDGFLIRKGDTNYYCIEPIETITLKDEADKKLVLSNKILTTCFFKNKQLDPELISNNDNLNNYANSDLRAYLNSSSNDGFLWQANIDPDTLETVEVDNSLTSTGDNENPYVCDNTNDKVFALSHSELNDYYPSVLGDENLVAKTTDFCRACLIFYNSGNNCGDYWLRTPANSALKTAGEAAKMVQSTGGIDRIVSYEYTYYNGAGIRPAFWVFKDFIN